MAAAVPALPETSGGPPPGWRDVTSQTKAQDLLRAYAGPEESSFVLVGMPAVDLDNAAAVRSYLMHVLAGLRAGSRLDYRPAGGLETHLLSNGISAQLLRASLHGKPRLVLAAFETGGRPVLATLSSAAPEAMLSSLLGGALAGEALSGVRTSGLARSLDGQLELSLGGGLSSRQAQPGERSRGAVLVVQGSGAEVLFFKLSEDDVAPKDQPAVVRATVADALKVPLGRVSPASTVRTFAGPTAVCAWAGVPGSPDIRFAAGFLPWGYWGYSLLARGPLADELLAGVLAALKQGPSAVPGLVAASPTSEVPQGAARHWLRAAFALGVVLVLGGLAWSLGRKKANLLP